MASTSTSGNRRCADSASERRGRRGICVPNPDFGEEVKAVVQPVATVRQDDQLVDELMAFARANLAAYKVPRSIDFLDELPRLPTGKLYKRLLKDQYWPAKS